MRRRTFYLTTLPVITLALAAGFIVADRRLGPYWDLHFLLRRLTLDRAPYAAISERAALTDPGELYRHAPPEQQRQAVVDYIWKGVPPSPGHLPDAIEDDPAARAEYGAASAELLRIQMAYGVDSQVRYVRQAAPGAPLLLYHYGHDTEFTDHRRVLERLWREGYSLLIFYMPLTGPNSRPKVTLPRLGTLVLDNHWYFSLLDDDHFSSLRFFVEPVIVSLNYAAQYHPAWIAMLGVSGGGWTTMVAAAIDPRITLSYPVAGSLPINLWGADAQAIPGDYEQLVPGFYRTATYLELYVLGAYGAGRHQLQIYNRYDSCCFAGVDSRRFEGFVAEQVSRLGAGSFAVCITDDDRHRLSMQALEMVIADMRAHTVPFEGVPPNDSTRR